MVIFGEEHMLIISAVLTLAILYLSEIVPKIIGALYWQSLAIPAAYVIRGLMIVTYPLLFISTMIRKMFKETGTKTSREEIQALSELGELEGILDEQESDIIENLLNLKTSKVGDILTPRSVLFAMSKEMTVGEFFSLEDKDTFSRIPIYDGTVDNITGVILLRTVLMEYAQGRRDKALEELAVPIFSLNENIPVSKALELFIKRREHIFVVKDKFNQTQGIVTLEDAIETLLGMEIMDEFDDIEDLQVFAKLKMRQKTRK